MKFWPWYNFANNNDVHSTVTMFQYHIEGVCFLFYNANRISDYSYNIQLPLCSIIYFDLKEEGAIYSSGFWITYIWFNINRIYLSEELHFKLIS